MPKRSSKSKDENQLAAMIVTHTTEIKPHHTKNPHAMALGRLGGLKGGKARAEKLSKRRRHEIAQRAAESRWRKNS